MKRIEFTLIADGGEPLREPGFADIARSCLMPSCRRWNERLPAELVPPFERFGELAAEGLRDGLLREAGVSILQSEMFRWTTEFPSERVLWELISGRGIFTRQFAALSAADQEQVRREVVAALAAYRQGNGSYKIPHTCRLLWGQR